MQQDETAFLAEIERATRAVAPGEDAIREAMRLLSERRSGYHWVGVYYLNGAMLELGPYFGPKTDHTRIPVGRGVCGTAVAENKNQVIKDVRELDNYLACNLETRSEIVVLIREPETGRVLGQIDVDGTEVDRFRDEEPFLERVAEVLAPHLLHRVTGTK